LKAADFGNDDILYLMEDMLPVKSVKYYRIFIGKLTLDDVETGCKSGDFFSASLFKRLLEEEYEKLQNATNRDVYDASKNTTLPISKRLPNDMYYEIKLPYCGPPEFESEQYEFENSKGEDRIIYR
jgi:malate synthase